MLEKSNHNFVNQDTKITIVRSLKLKKIMEPILKRKLFFYFEF